VKILKIELGGLYKKNAVQIGIWAFALGLGNRLEVWQLDLQRACWLPFLVPYKTANPVPDKKIRQSL
jgi:hypothetical protein